MQLQDIAKRGEAVESLLTDFSEESAAARKLLKAVPDLERLLQRVHCNGYVCVMVFLLYRSLRISSLHTTTQRHTTPRNTTS